MRVLRLFLILSFLGASLSVFAQASGSENSQLTERQRARAERRAARKARAKKRRQRKCSINTTYKPKCWQERDKAELNIALIYYGDKRQMDLEDLDRIEGLLKKRFLKATDNALGINVIAKKIIPFKQKMPVGYTYNQITDPERLQRIWYIENVNGKVLEEIYHEYKRYEAVDTIHKLDLVLAITGAQFNALGFASGRMSVTEYPSEVGYGLPGGGKVEYPSDYTLVDELIHELGHNMFIGHATPQCTVHKIKEKLGTNKVTREVLQEVRKCCDEAPSGSDVMSYCRNRNKVSETHMHGFEKCNLNMIKRLIIPNILKGGVWNVQNRSRCM